MTAPELLLALRDLEIVIAADGDSLNVDAPKGALTVPIAAALKEHKPVLLAVYRTLNQRDRDADWDLVRDWLIGSSKTFTPAMQRAAGRILPIGSDEWPEAYARRFRSSLRVRGLLKAIGDVMTKPVPHTA